MTSLRRRSFLVALFFLFFSEGFAARGALADDASAPFGLTWGMSAADAEKIGVALTPLPNATGYGTTYSATNLPKILSDTETCFLSFGYGDRLARIVAGGKEVKNDPYGSAVVGRYIELAKNLGELYGKGKETDRRDTEIWKAPSEYVASLKNGRAKRFTDFANENARVQIMIAASSSDEARYVIFFESIAEMKKLDEAKKAKEKEAL